MLRDRPALRVSVDTGCERLVRSSAPTTEDEDQQRDDREHDEDNDQNSHGSLPNLADPGLNVAPPGYVRHSEAGGLKGSRERPQQTTGRASARPVLRVYRLPLPKV